MQKWYFIIHIHLACSHVNLFNLCSINQPFFRDYLFKKWSKCFPKCNWTLVSVIVMNSVVQMNGVNVGAGALGGSAGSLLCSSIWCAELWELELPAQKPLCSFDRSWPQCESWAASSSLNNRNYCSTNSLLIDSFCINYVTRAAVIVAMGWTGHQAKLGNGPLTYFWLVQS